MICSSSRACARRCRASSQPMRMALVYIYGPQKALARVLDLRVSTPFQLVNASLEESHEYPIAQFNG